MKYFALVDELFTFKYLLTEDSLDTLSKEMLASEREVTTTNTITSNQIEETDAIARTDRNNAIYFDVIRRARKESSGSIEERKSLIDFIKKKAVSENDTLITNTCVAAFLADIYEFKPSEPSESSTIGGTPYIIGTIGNLRIIVDPYMNWTDTRMFIYNRSKVLTGAYIESVITKSEPTMASVAETKMILYSEELEPIENFAVKIPTEELI